MIDGIVAVRPVYAVPPVGAGYWLEIRDQPGPLERLVQKLFTTPEDIRLLNPNAGAAMERKFDFLLARFSMTPGEREARALLQKFLEHTAEVDRCKECVGPAEHSDCHRGKWLELKKRVKAFLAAAPN